MWLCVLRCEWEEWRKFESDEERREEKAAAFGGRLFVWAYIAVDKCGCTGPKPTAEYCVHDKEQNESIWPLGRTHGRHEYLLRCGVPPENKWSINYDLITCPLSVGVRISLPH